MSEKFSRYLVSASVSGGKFWEVEVQGTTLRTRYGKLGASPSWSSKEFPSHDKALAEAQKQVRKKTGKGYAEAPKTSMVDGFAGVDLMTIPFAGVFYFRAHDRYPGGNADMFTVKVTLISRPGQAPILTATTHRNWDGGHYLQPEGPLPLDLEATLPAMCEAAAALLSAGATDGQYSVHDPRYDSEAYNTEWSNIELSLLALPEEGEGAIEDSPTFLRFRQKAVYGRGSVSHDPPDAVSQAFLERVMLLCGLGRVEAYSENQSDFCKAFQVDSQDLGYLSAGVPLYL